MPTEQSLKLLAPDKNREDMIKPMQYLKEAILQNHADKKVLKKTPLFAPAGQSTQMVIGATPESDMQILLMSDHFYKRLSLKRVYYSGYVPVSTDNRLPAIGTPVPMIRENRLYQADWLMRFYGFKVGEIVNPDHPHLDMDIDPKLSWALRNLQIFPVDINKADLQLIMRIPGIGVSSSKKIVAARKFTKLTWEHLKKIGISLNRAKHFITWQSKSFDRKELLPMQIKQQIMSMGTTKYQPNFSPQLKIF
jgi:predicted DNA-binding helix-hairpin-helix protein